MSTHATLSPSKRERWANCPGSVREEAKYPEERSSAAAIDGTHTHTVLERAISTGTVDVRSWINEQMSDHDGQFVVTPAQVERVQFALNYIHERHVLMGNCEIRAETKVNPARIFGRDDLAGTVDVTLISDDTIEIIDYKDGMSTVEVEDNLQLDTYGFGIIAALADENLKVKQSTIRFTIIQPKLREKGMSGIASYERPMLEFMMGEQRLARQAAATDSPIAPLIPGEKQCKYCKHKGACSALNTQSLESLGIASPNLDVAKQAAEKNPTEMTDKQILEIMEAAPLIRQMLEGVEKEAFKRVNAGRAIEGLKLVRGRGSREWAYEETEMVEKLKKFGIPKDELWKTKLISPAQAEKVVWKKRDGTVKQLSERQLKTMHEEYVKKNEGALQIALASDERPAVVTDVANMFGAVGSVETVPELPDFLQLPDFLK